MKNEALKFLKKICKNRVKVTKRMVIFFLMTGGLLLSQVNFSETVDETKSATIKDLKNYDYPNSLHFVSVQYSEDDVKGYKDYYKYLDLLKEKIGYLKEIALEEANGKNKDKDKINGIKEKIKKLKITMEKLKEGNELISQKVTNEIEKNLKKPKNSDKDKKIEEINKEYTERMNEINKLSTNFNNLGIDFAHSIAIGKGAEISGENGIAIGVDTLSGKDSISLGKASIASGEGNIAIGRDATLFSKTFKGKVGQQIARILNNPNTIVKFENEGDVEYKKTIVIGDGTKSSGNSNIAIGDNAVAMKKRLTLISLQNGGTLSNKNGAEIEARNWNDIAKQFYKPDDDDKRNYTFEAKPVENAIALGKNASAFADNVIAIGKGAISGFESAVSIGENADTEGKNSVAIGKNSKIFGESSVAIGEGSRTGKIKYVLKTIDGKDTVEKTEEFDTLEAAKQELEKKKDDLSKIYRIEVGGEKSEYSVAIGKGSAVEDSGSVAIGADSLAVESNGKSAFTEVDHTSGETVSFGNSNKKRRLTNVADGKDSSDAVTVAQLQKAIADNKGGSGGSAVDSKVSVEGGEGIKVTSANNKYTVALADGLKTKIDGALQSDEADGKYAKLDGSNITEANWVGKLGDASIENGTKLAKSSAVKTYVDTEINNISTKVSSKLSSDDVDVKGDAYISVASDATKTNHYTLTFDKEKLGKELDLTNNTNLNTKLSKYALLDGTNLNDDFNLTNWGNALGKGTIANNNKGLVTGSTVYNYMTTFKQQLSNESTQDLAKKLSTDASNLTDGGVTTLTNKLGTGEVAEGDTKLVTGGKVYSKINEVKSDLDNKYTTLNNQVTTNTGDIKTLKTDVEDLKKTKQDITNINTKLDGKLDKADLSITGDDYIKVNKGKKFDYTLSFNKTKLESDLDLTKNASVNNIVDNKLAGINTNLGDLTTKVKNNTDNITTLTGNVNTNTNDIKTLKQGKLNADANNLTKDGETNLIDKLSKGSDISKPNNRLVTDNQVNTYLSRYNDALGVVDKKSTVALEKSELALGGVANAVAMANLVQVNSYSDYRHNLSAAYGYYGGSHALAVGFSGTNEERNFVYKLSGSVNNKGNLAFGVGAGVMLGDKDERLTTEYSTKLKTVEKDLVEANKKIKEYEERQKATDIKVKELERKLNQILNKH